jgi:HSP20 family protein
MADPQANAPEPQARPGRADHSDAAPPRAPAEARAFEAVADVAKRALDNGADTARDMTQAGAEAGREAGRHLADARRETSQRITETSRRGADLWRESMAPFFALSSEMNRRFDEAWRQALAGVATPGMAPLGAPSSAVLQGLMGLPSADLRETPSAYHITVELAGMAPDDVEVSLDGDSLVVSGERRDEHRETKGGYRVAERRFGRFERRFALGRDADREAIRAEFDNGLLKITAPRHHEDAPGRRRIEVSPPQPTRN